MPVSIISNLSSQYAISALKSRSDALSISSQRLSTGQRVFNADQDAAAYAVGRGLQIENSTLNKAKINAASGVSMLQIADGAMSAMSDILSRMKVLATQASSGHVDSTSRAVINQEFQTLSTELDRLARVTNFNGVNMLAGSSSFSLQGAHDISSDGVETLAFNNSTVTADAVFRYSYDSSAESMTLTKISGGTSQSQTIDMTALLDGTAGTGQQLGVGDHVALNFNALGMTLTVGNGFDRTVDVMPSLTDMSGTDITLGTQTFVPAATSVGTDAVTALQGLGSAYNHVTGAMTFGLTSDGTAVSLDAIPGISYAVNGGAIGASGAASSTLVGGATTVDVYVDTASGQTLLGTLDLGVVSTTLTPSTGQIIASVGQGIVGETYVDSNGPTRLTYAVGTGSTVGDDLLTVNVAALSSSALGIDTLALTSQMTADAAINALDVAMDKLNNARSDVGAQQARLERVGDSIATSIENNETARSALMDTDVSAEISNMTNQQTMLQVGVSMLSQANKIPDMLLQLLK